eukprot:6199177-Pleurochrysis_carterae.AAC.6
MRCGWEALELVLARVLNQAPNSSQRGAQRKPIRPSHLRGAVRFVTFGRRQWGCTGSRAELCSRNGERGESEGRPVASEVISQGVSV